MELRPDNPHLKTNSTSLSTLEYLSLVTDYISIPLCTAALAADLLLVIIILKYKRLKNRTNFYLIHFSICHILYIISSPLIYYTIADIFYGGYMEMHWYCVWIRIENSAMGLAFSFIGTYGIDSFLKNVKPTWFLKYKKRYIYVLLFFYFGHFLIYLISACICIKKGFTNNFNFYFLSAYFFIVLTGVLYLTHKEQKMEKDLKLSTPYKAYALFISVVVLLIWLPLICFYNLMFIFSNFERVERVLMYTIFLPEYLAYCCPMVIIYKLWNSSKHFNTAFRRVVRRSVIVGDLEELNIKSNDE